MGQLFSLEFLLKRDLLISLEFYSFSNSALEMIPIFWRLQVKKERAEREALGALPLYQRTIP